MPKFLKNCFACWHWNFQMSHTARTRTPGMRTRDAERTLVTSIPYDLKNCFACWHWNFQMSHTARTRTPGMRTSDADKTRASAPKPMRATLIWSSFGPIVASSAWRMLKLGRNAPATAAPFTKLRRFKLNSISTSLRVQAILFYQNRSARARTRT